ncbi:MAG: hypothetical protein K2H64_09815 [Desulfovibrio sp.]|nr:hypothetical protein [Desulfovibrio sp.]
MKYLKIVWAFVPSFARLGLISKISLTIFIGGLCAELFYAKINQALPLLKGALTFSPANYAKELIAKDHLKTAEEYLNFYASIPGVSLDKETRELLNKAHDGRSGLSGILRQGKHAWRGVTGAESDEFVAQATDIAVDFTGVGDVRDLYREYKNYSEGKDVDSLSAGLAGIGLAMTLGELAGTIGAVPTGGASAGLIALCEPVKKLALGVKKALKYMNPKLKNATHKLFGPIFKKIADARLFERLPINLSSLPSASFTDKLADLGRGAMKMADISQWKTYFRTNLAKIDDIAKFAADKMSSLADVAKLGVKDPAAARLIAETAPTVKRASGLSRMALELGEAGKNIFRFGGKNAVAAMETLGKAGKLSVKTLKEAMRFGPDGLKAVAKGCFRGLNRMIALIHKFAPLLWQFLFLALLAKIPLLQALGFEAAALAILFKTWRLDRLAGKFRSGQVALTTKTRRSPAHSRAKICC